MSDHGPPSVAASTPSISEVHVDLTEEAVQHLSTTSPTQPVAGSGNQILLKKNKKKPHKLAF